MGDRSSICVTVRVRPFTIREAAQITRIDDAPTFFGDGSLASMPTPKLTGKGVRSVVKVIDDRVLVFDPPEDNPVARYQKTILPQGKKVKDMRFGFDRVFDETATQDEVYEATTRSLLDSVLDGFNSTVFAYGATGCGKTHTISGTPQHPGIIFLTCAELFDRINALSGEKEIELTLSYLEIYNETIRDLLVPGGSKLGLQLREDTNQNISVAGLSTHSPKNVQEVMNMILMGNANRTISPTEANATSSRSHAVLQINVMQKPRTAGMSENHMFATLSIIDLAGSERASVTKNRGDRLLEGANINRSLLALGNCINALCDPHKSNHVPYRDSKLTRLLKFSLGGNCKTVMIVCVSPSSQHYEETHNTLKYADRAKKIKTKVSRNTMNVNRHVSQYVKAIYELRTEVEELKKRLNDSTKEAMEKIVKQGGAKDTAMREGTRKLKAAYEHSKDLQRERINDLKSLRVVERRISLVSTWIAAFDHVFKNRQYNQQPTVYKARDEAEKVLSELRGNQKYLQQKLSGPGCEKVIDQALMLSLRSLQAIEGIMETDLSALTCEANLLKMTAERDALHAVANTDPDFSSIIHTLSKAHFETVAKLSQIGEINVSEEQAVEQARKSLFEVQKAASDAVSHIIKPNGELASIDSYRPAQYTQPVQSGTPRRRMGIPVPSPAKQPNFNNVATAPPQSFEPQTSLPHPKSPRPVKVKTPKKGVKFGRKPDPKKSVRWQDEDEDGEDDTFLDEPRQKRLNETSTIFEESIYDDTNERTRQEFSLSFEASQGIVAPPIRPRNNRLEVGFLSKNKDTKPSIDLNPMRQRSATISTTHKRRVSASTSQISPNGDMFGIGHARRMPRSERDNRNGSGNMSTVLSPKREGVKASARRMTVNGGSFRVNKDALLGHVRESQRERAGRESIGGAGLGRNKWR
ncbi:uncharacterized protein H6S33_005362 [Morchella sextelata]|uniref:uncharacterized protein n=1 Tax=Morchella sextelata TaxID=1174677 RepID=UPI001D05522C|nr:uncharacterized protein H6S33_005362 [Morchella sextelata]KAH0613476.1 hypothetical protein H6S33_005362 [Morchella sextelata]